MWIVLEEISLDAVEIKPVLHSVASRNRSDSLRAAAAVPVLAILLPFAVGFMWYGLGVVGPTISAMPATGTALCSADYIAFVAVYGRQPNVQDWLGILLGAGVGYALAMVVATILASAGLVSIIFLAGVLSWTGIGIGVATAIFGM